MALQPVGVGDEVLSELREGRTRELLMLLQDKPVPEVQDPMNLQESLSDTYETENDDYIMEKSILVDDFESGDDTTANDNWDWVKVSHDVQSNNVITGDYSAEISVSGNSKRSEIQADGNAELLNRASFAVEVDENGDYRDQCFISFRDIDKERWGV